MSKSYQPNVVKLSDEVEERYNKLYAEWQKAANNHDPKCEELLLQLKNIINNAIKEEYAKEVKTFAKYVNERLLYEGKKTAFQRKLNSIAKKYNKKFEEVFCDYDNARMGF